VSARSGATPVPGDGGGPRAGAKDEDLGGRGRGVEVEQRAVTKPARTSVAAVFALVFGVLALFSVLIVILAPVGLVFGVIGLILGVVGLRRARRPGITGKGVAAGGLVLSVVAVLLGGCLRRRGGHRVEQSECGRPAAASGAEPARQAARPSHRPPLNPWEGDRSWKSRKTKSCR